MLAMAVLLAVRCWASSDPGVFVVVVCCRPRRACLDVDGVRGLLFGVVCCCLLLFVWCWAVV